LIINKSVLLIILNSRKKFTQHITYHVQNIIYLKKIQIFFKLGTSLKNKKYSNGDFLKYRQTFNQSDSLDAQIPVGGIALFYGDFYSLIKKVK